MTGGRAGGGSQGSDQKGRAEGFELHLVGSEEVLRVRSR